MTDVEVVDTVDWYGDGDDQAFATSVEQTFAMELPQQLDWLTFGDVLEHVDREIRERGDGDQCASQMTFYRLRRALELHPRSGPGDDLPIAPMEPAKGGLRELSVSIGLVVPPADHGLRWWLGASMVVAGFCIGQLPIEPWLKLGVGLGMVVSGVTVARSDPGRLPSEWKTLGDMASAIARHNRGLLAQQGARLRREEIWGIIQEVAALESGIDPARVGYDTTLFKPKRKRA